MKKKTISTRVMLSTFMALILIILVFAYVNNSQRIELSDGSLAITHKRDLVTIFSMDDLKQMEKIEFNKTISSSSRDDEQGIFSGVLVRTILSEADPELVKNGTRVISKAKDSFVSAYSMDEVLNNDSIVVIYEKDGKSLGSMEAGGTGPLRIIVIDDVFGTRSTMYLNELSVE